MKKTTEQLNNKFKEVKSIVIMFDDGTTHADVVGQFVRKLSKAGFADEPEIIENMEMVKILLDIK